MTLKKCTVRQLDDRFYRVEWEGPAARLTEAGGPVRYASSPLIIEATRGHSSPWHNYRRDTLDELLADFGLTRHDKPETAEERVRALSGIGATDERIRDQAGSPVTYGDLRATLEGPCSFCLETPGHGAAKPICDGCAQLATDQAKTSRDLVERIATLEAERAEVAREARRIADRAWESDDPRCGDLLWELADRLEQPASAEPADTIPRATLAKALRERAKRRGAESAQEKCASDAERRYAQRLECDALADEIERGEWPKEGE